MMNPEQIAELLKFVKALHYDLIVVIVFLGIVVGFLLSRAGKD